MELGNIKKNNYQVIVVGAGPTGLVLANLLGQLGVRVLVLEKEVDVFAIPRATHIDEETQRNFQMTGLMPQLLPHTKPFGMADVVDKHGKVLFTEEVRQTVSPHQYNGSCFFDQPAFERVLRKGLLRYPHVTLLAGVEVQLVGQSRDDASVIAKDLNTGQRMELRADWLVGCDGGKSLVRTSAGLLMEQLEQPREWVIVDALLKDETDAQLLPPNFRYYLQDERLSLFASGIGLNRRWEFQLGKGEPMPSQATILQWVAHYVPLDRIVVTRVAQYAHNSLVAKQWRKGRLFIAGDAAHMMPPSAGQGMCSGVRDAVNLAWKLGAVINGQAPTALLSSYEQERKPHLYNMLRRTLFVGNRLQGNNPWQRLWRNMQLRAIQSMPVLKNLLRANYIVSPPLVQGCLGAQSILAGHHLPQFGFSDDAMGYRFAFIALPNTLTTTQMQELDGLGMTIVLAERGENSEPFILWLHQNKLDFAIVRPDKIIFAAGKTMEIEGAINQLKQWIAARSAQLEPVS